MPFLAICTPFGLPRPFACRWLYRREYPRVAWTVLAVLDAAIVAFALDPALLFPFSTAFRSIEFSAPLWIVRAQRPRTAEEAAPDG